MSIVKLMVLFGVLNFGVTCKADEIKRSPETDTLDTRETKAKDIFEAYHKHLYRVVGQCADYENVDRNGMTSGCQQAIAGLYNIQHLFTLKKNLHEQFDEIKHNGKHFVKHSVYVDSSASELGVNVVLSEFDQQLKNDKYFLTNFNYQEVVENGKKVLKLSMIIQDSTWIAYLMSFVS